MAEKTVKALPLVPAQYDSVNESINRRTIEQALQDLYSEVGHVKDMQESGISKAVKRHIFLLMGASHCCFNGGSISMMLTALAGIKLPDDEKIFFGDSDDLQIWHSGTDSIIKDTGVGGIKIDSNYTAIRSANGSETSAKFLENSAVELYYDNVKKVETTSSGIDVSGRLDVAQDLRLRGNSSTPDVGVASISIADANGSINFDAGNDGTNMSLTSTGLGIGTNSPDRLLNIEGSVPAVRLTDTTTTGMYHEILGDGNSLSIEADDGNVGSSSSINFKVDGSERARINSSGFFGINTTSPDAPLTIHNSSDPEIRFGYSSTQDHKISWDSSKVYIEADPENANGSSAIGFRVDGTQRGIINSTGTLEVSADANNGVKISSSSPYLFFNDTDTANVYDSSISQSGATLNIGGATPAQTLKFRNLASFAESARITTSGDFLVGKTTTSTGVAGARFSANGFSNVTRDGAECINFNRLTSNGTIIDFRKDSSTIGIIGTDSNSQLVLGSGDTGLSFQSNNDAIIPRNTDGTARNEFINLGTTGAKFKDLHLSGNAYLGAVSSAGGTISSGADTFANVAMSFAKNDYIYSDDGTYLRKVIGHNISGNIEIGQTGTALINDIELKAGSSGNIRFYGTGSENARVTNAGHFLVGKTAANNDDVGTTIYNSAGMSVTRSSGVPLILNRKTNDGTILEIRKDGTGVGSFGTYVGYPFVGKGDTTLLFNPDGDRIIPRGSSGGQRDAAIDLGGTSDRFKDIYLSGGAYLGGTAAANKLDDYEEGTFTLTTAGDSTGAFNGTPTCHYTKIGNMVTVLIAFRVGTNFSGNEVGGLPFTTSHSGMVSSFINAGQVITSTSNTISATVGNGVTNIRFHNNQNTGDSHNPNTTAEYYRLSFTYRAA